MDDDPDPTAFYKQPIFWLALAVGLAVGFPLGRFVASQVGG